MALAQLTKTLKTHFSHQVTLPRWVIYYAFAVMVVFVLLFRYLPTWMFYTIFFVFPFAQSWTASTIVARHRRRQQLDVPQ